VTTRAVGSGLLFFGGSVPAPGYGAYDDSIDAVVSSTLWVISPDGTLGCDEDDRARSTHREQTFTGHDVAACLVAEPAFGEYAELLAHSPALPTPTSPPRETGL